jgi:hypothetical protein
MKEKFIYEYYWQFVERKIRNWTSKKSKCPENMSYILLAQNGSNYVFLVDAILILF